MTVPKAPVVAAMAVASRPVLVRNVTAVVKSGTLLVRVPRLPTLVGMVAAEAEAEATLPLGEVKLGAYSSCSSGGLFDRSFSYTCGGVGHLSRDCVQGSKCYNCSGIVREGNLGRGADVDGFFLGTYQSGLPSATEARLLHLRLRGVRLVHLLLSRLLTAPPSDTSRAIALAFRALQRAFESGSLISHLYC